MRATLLAVIVTAGIGLAGAPASAANKTRVPNQGLAVSNAAMNER